MIYTFWEGSMPAYIKLCLDTWKLPFTILTYDNIRQYTDFDIEGAKRFTLPQIADAVRVHVLRDNGGYWMDTDTIMLSEKLPDATILGNPITRTNTIGFLNTEPHSDMFEKWAAYQDRIIATSNYDSRWDVLGNRFTDAYLHKNRDVSIGTIRCRWPETYKMPSMPRYSAYQRLYFGDSLSLADFEETDLLMLHNSWTPGWFKELSESEVLSGDKTLSNILREVLE